jgi:RND family efflux transporter MFP subunit
MPRAATLLLLLPALAACRAETPAAAADTAPAPRPVQVAEVQLAPAAGAAAYTGTVRARHEVDLGFRTGGRIVQRLVELGDTVEAGQELARLDPADLGLALRSAEADLAAAEAQARQAANDAARSRALLAAGHVATAFDDQRQAAARAAAERVTSARAALDLARNRLSYATLRAPTAGVVTALLAEAGQVVPEGQPVLRLADPSQRELLVRVPESGLAALGTAAAEARFWARPDITLPATLRELAPQAEGALRTYTARFALPAAPGWVALGMTGTVRLATEAAPVATLPLGALHDRGAGPMVWRVTPEGRVEAVPVAVRSLTETTAEVTASLQPGERVVALGPQLLDPASRVRVVSTRLAATLR